MLLLQQALPAQTAKAVPLPKRFEVYYELRADTFDSEKKTRVFDAVGGQITYNAELTNEEKQKTYEAIVQNNLLKVKNSFTDLGNVNVEPASLGKLRLKIDGTTKEIRFNSAYGWAKGGNTPDEEWTRLRNVLDVIERILRDKDRQQKLPPHQLYL